MDDPKYEELMILVRDPLTTDENYHVVECDIRYEFGGGVGKPFHIKGVVRHSSRSLKEAERFIRDLYPYNQ